MVSVSVSAEVEHIVEKNLQVLGVIKSSHRFCFSFLIVFSHTSTFP